MVLLLLSCGREENTGDKKIFRYNESTGIATLDPAFAKNQSIMWPVHQLYSTLVEVDSNMKLKPLLAKSWEFQDQGKKIIFHLRTGVKFHSDKAFGSDSERILKASDVVFSLKRITDPATASPGAWIFSNRLNNQEPFEAPDDSTFIINLSSPFSPILGILSMQYCSIISERAAKYYGAEFRRNPVGTGPFQIVNWTESQALILKKNPDYFESDSNGIRLPYIDGIAVRFYDSKATEFLEFRQGRLDFINDVDPSFKDELLSKSGALKTFWQEKINMRQHPYLNTEYLGILSDTSNAIVKNSPLKDLRVRQALAYAIDRRKMILNLRNSIGTAAAGGFIPLGLPGHDTTETIGCTFNPAIAAQLLSQAGYSATNPLPEITLSTVPTYANLAGFIASELQQQGFRIKINVVQKSLLLEQTSKSNVLFFRGSWIADYPDAENYLSVFYSANPAPPNYTRFNDPGFDAAYNALNRSTGEAERLNYIHRADSIVMSKAFVIPLWYDKVLHFTQKNISNFSPNSLNMLELRSVKIN